MKVPFTYLSAFATIALLMAGCSTAPPTTVAKDQLQNDSTAALADMKAQDPGINDLLKSSYGYAVFPNVGKGAAGVGGAYGHGEVYEQGQPVGYVEMTQGTVGAALGGETFSELIVFKDADSLQRFKAGSFTFEADASAVGIKPGVSASTKFDHGTAVLIDIKGGLMAEASVGGQKFNYQPMEARS